MTLQLYAPGKICRVAVMKENTVRVIFMRFFAETVFLSVIFLGCQYVEVVKVEDNSPKDLRNIASGNPKKIAKENNNRSERPVYSIESAVIDIGGEYITAEEIAREVKPKLATLAKQHPESVFYEKALGYIADTVRQEVAERLLYREVLSLVTEEQRGIIDKAVDKAIDEMVALQAGGSRVKFERQLAQKGVSLQELRERLKRQFLTRQYLREKFWNKIIITRDEVWEYYQRHRKEFYTPAKVRIKLIEVDASRFLPTGVKWEDADVDQRELAVELAEKQSDLIIQKLQRGAKFDLLAKKFSSAPSGRFGGDIGWISKGSYKIKKVEDIAFRMIPGTINKIPLGRKIYIIKLVERKDAHLVSFPEAQKVIEPKLREKKYNEMVNRFMEELWEGAKIGSVRGFVRSVLRLLPSYRRLREVKF